MKLFAKFLLNPGTCKGGDEPIYFYGPVKLKLKSGKTAYIDFENYDQEIENGRILTVVGYKEDFDNCPDMQYVLEHLSEIESIEDFYISPVNDNDKLPCMLIYFNITEETGKVVFSTIADMSVSINEILMKDNISIAFYNVFYNHVFISNADRYYFATTITSYMDINDDCYGFDINNDIETNIKNIKSNMHGIKEIIPISEVDIDHLLLTGLEIAAAKVFSRITGTSFDDAYNQMMIRKEYLLSNYSTTMYLSK